jgi:NADH dehydrogenase
MKQRVLVLGAGFAGVWSALGAARQLDLHDRHDIQITVLAPQAELRIRPRFYEANVHEMKASLLELFDATGIDFVQGQASQIDVQGKRVEYVAAQGVHSWVSFDRLVLATGSHLNRPQLEGVHDFTFDVDTIESAERLEVHLRELARLPQSPARNTVVVCGGGFTGIETATEMPSRLREALGHDARIRVIVVDRGPSIGAALGSGISPSIIEASIHLGIEWQVGAMVAKVDANGVTLADGTSIESKTVIWTAGFQASLLTRQIPGEHDPLGRLYVDENLKVLGQDAVYAAGDVAFAATDDLGNFAAMSCQHAISLGRHAGHNVVSHLLGVEPQPYRQPKYVTCLDLGEWGAVYTEGWDREVKLIREEAKELKKNINSVWIYPPVADRATALASADPSIPVA